MLRSINPIIIIVSILLIVVLFNLALFFRWKQRPHNNENQATTGLINSIRSPWKEEDHALEELAALIKTVQDEPPEDNDIPKIRNTDKKSSDY